MNIFVLDNDPIIAAKYHMDKHVVKMILEYAQLLSTTHHLTDSPLRYECYKPTHKNHPCAKWVRESRENYRWLYHLFYGVCGEYCVRYNKVHKTFLEKQEALKNIPEDLESNGLTEFPLCMPDYCKVENDPVQSYRNYYINEKNHIANWKTDVPEWYGR